MKTTTRNPHISLSTLLCAVALHWLSFTGFAQPQYVQVGNLPLPSASDRVEVFDSASQQLFSFPTYNNGGYVSDGYVSDQGSSDTFAFTKLAGLASVYWGRVATDGTNVYAVGGYGFNAYYVEYVPIASVPLSPVWRSTTILPNLVYPIGRALHQTFIYQGNLYVLGGYHGSGPLYSDVWYAPILTGGALGSFVQTTSLPKAMCSHSAAVSSDGKLYVGYGTNLYFAQIAADGTIGTFTAQPAISGMNHYIGSGNNGMALLGNLLVIVDGTTTFVCRLNASGQVDSLAASITNSLDFGTRSVYAKNGTIYVTSAATGKIYRLDGLPTGSVSPPHRDGQRRSSV